MSIQFLTALRTARAQAWVDYVGTSPKVRLYTGSPPSLPSDAATGTMLVEHQLDSTPFTVSSGVITFNDTPVTTNGAATGSAGYYRIYKSDGTTCVEQGTVGTSGADLAIDNTSINSGQQTKINSWTKTEPNA